MERCNNCNVTLSEDDEMWNDFGGELYCSECYDELVEANNGYNINDANDGGFWACGHKIDYSLRLPN